ncbi:MAG: hypothetical protein ABNH03_13725 [Alteromonas sp.]|jgi:hypothetical protein|uniref:hypothetical protein n=1 Tax=Alteromonas sp. TaxID=232 RepID=UPI0032D9161C
MSKYEFVISAKDKTAQAFSSINSGLGSLKAGAVKTATAVAGVTAAFGALMVSSANNAKELQKQADLAGENVENFQSLSYAFSMFNIEQEKFADISKDVQDKLGDFLATGAGPFADFFENVAPKVDLTADALRDLSSTDVLIAVKKAMDDANVSAKEQVFYMEAIANDASLLLKPLQDNGKAIKEYAAEFDKLNVAMSEAEVEKMAELAREFKRIEVTASSIGNKLATNFAEPLGDILEIIEDDLPEHLLKAELGFKSVAAGIFEVSAASAQFVKYNPFALLAGGITPDEAQQRYEDFKGTANLIYDDINEIQGKLKELDNPDFGETSDIFDGMEDMFDLNGAITNIDTSPLTDAGKKVSDSFLESLSLIDEINANAFTFDESMAENAGLFWENFEERGFTAYNNLQEGNESFWDQWLEAAQTNLTSFDEMSAFTIESFSNQMGDALESIIFDSQSLGDAFQGVMQNMARGVVNALGQMAAQWLAYKIVQMTVGASTAAAGSAGLALNAQAAALQAGINAFASTAAIPVVGPPAAPAAMKAALAVTQPMAMAVSAMSAGAATASFDGGGYTPNGARIGGIDGKGGKLAMLHPREKVVDLTRQNEGGQNISVNYAPNYSGNNATTIDLDTMASRDRKRLIRQLQRAMGRPV